MTFGEVRGHEDLLKKLDPSKPIEVGKQIAMNGWNRFRARVFELQKSDLNKLDRFLILQEPTTNFAKKLDLIDTHPDLFRENSKYPKLAEREIDMLRVLVMGDTKPFRQVPYDLDQN